MITRDIIFPDSRQCLMNICYCKTIVTIFYCYPVFYCTHTIWIYQPFSMLNEDLQLEVKTGCLLELHCFYYLLLYITLCR